MVKEHGSQSKDDATKETSRDEGISKEEARIPDAEVHHGRNDRRHPPYEKWTRETLYAHARSRRIAGRSSMSKQQLIKALRNH